MTQLKNKNNGREKNKHLLEHLESLDMDKLEKVIEDIEQDTELPSLEVEKDSDSFNITASSIEKGLEKGAKHFNTCPEDLKYEIINEPELDPAGNPVSPYLLVIYPPVTFRKIEIRVSQDRLTATIPKLFPQNAAGKPYTLAEIMEQIDKAGIKYGIYSAGLEKAYGESQEKEESIKNVVIARGLKPISAVPDGYTLTIIDKLDADEKDMFKPSSNYSTQLIEAFDASTYEEVLMKAPGVFVVYTNRIIARFLRGKPGTAGIDVFGKEIPPGEDKVLSSGSKVRLNNKNELESICYGYLYVKSGKISVKPPLWLSPAHMTVKFIWLDTIGPAKIPKKEEIQALLKKTGIVYGVTAIDIEMLVQGLTKNPGTKGAYPLAKGSPPVPGSDAEVTYSFKEMVLPGQISSDGHIDYRERNYIRTIKKGRVIAEKKHPETGVDGVDVFGKIIPFKLGKDIHLEAGQNVSVDNTDKKIIRFVAEITGRISFMNNILSVHRSVNINGDIDFSTGNIRFDGDITVSGSVKPNFSITATGDIIIMGHIESGAHVQSNGHIVVSKGIVGENTIIKAGGCVKAQFIEKAEINADGDIHIGVHCVGARIRCGGIVFVPGKGVSSSECGVVVGGRIFAFKGIQARSVGSVYNSNTELIVGIDPKIQDKLFDIEKLVDLYERQTKKLMRTLGEDFIKTSNLHEVVKKLPPDRRQIMTLCLNKLKEIMDIQKKLKKQELEDRNKVVSECTKVKIEVHDIIFPYVKIRIGNRFVHTNDVLKGATLRIDPKTDSIVW